MNYKLGDRFRCISYVQGGSEKDTWDGIVTEISRTLCVRLTISWRHSSDDDLRVVSYSSKDLLEYVNKGVIWRDCRMGVSLPEELFTI